MKRTAISMAALMAAFSMGSAQAEPNNVGCGWGTMVFEGQKEVAPQVLAATTNGTFGNQTFGITSGTAGCSRDGVIKPPVKVSMFTGSNMDKLARDMSRGSGETLDTLAGLMGVAEADKPAFFAAVKANFDDIYAHDDVTAEDVLTSLNEVLAGHQQLQQYTMS